MKEAVIDKETKVTIADVGVPEPAARQVLIKVVVSGSNPKDWKLPIMTGNTFNEGDDIAGVVVKVGADVTEFRAGDRVAAFHEMRSPHGSYAEYAIAWADTTFHLAAGTSFEEAATVPLVGLTVAVSLFNDLALPPPWTPAKEPIPLIVYGASSAVGAAAVQLARASNIHPIIAVAGQSAPVVEKLLDASKGDVLVDYRGGDEAAVAALQKAVGGRQVRHALDAISTGSSSYITSQGLQDGGRLATVLPWTNDKRIPAGKVSQVQTNVGRVHADLKDLGFVAARYLGRALQQGTFHGHPYEVAPGGLAGVEAALNNLRTGKVHGFKYVFRIAETEGAGKDKL